MTETIRGVSSMPKDARKRTSSSTASARERAAIAEKSIKTVYLMQFMDSWTFDSVRLSKCSRQHLLPDGARIPSCGYYSYHRRFDPHFA